LQFGDAPGDGPDPVRTGRAPEQAGNRRVVLARRPHGPVVPGDFAVVTAPVPEPGPGETLVRTLHVSVDAGMRGRLVEAPNYAPPVALGAVVGGAAVVEVLVAGDRRFRPGELLVASTGWQDYAVLPAGAPTHPVHPGAPATASLGVLGISGVTAWVGVVGLGRVRPGDTVVVSTAAGAVGSAAGQLARAAGARTVGITGSAAKVALCTGEFGYDAAIDYHATPDLAAAVAAACPDGVDVFFDNVGGGQLDAVMVSIAVGGRILVCGTMALPAGTTPDGPRHERQLLVRRASIQGFLYGDWEDRWDEIVAELHGHWAAGRLRHREHVVVGLEAAPRAFAGLLSGENLGKTVVTVAAPGGGRP
jgi:NADPH-dependent curcumin reductase CurA